MNETKDSNVIEIAFDHEQDNFMKAIRYEGKPFLKKSTNALNSKEAANKIHAIVKEIGMSHTVADFIEKIASKEESPPIEKLVLSFIYGYSSLLNFKSMAGQLATKIVLNKTNDGLSCIVERCYKSMISCEEHKSSAALFALYTAGGIYYLQNHSDVFAKALMKETIKKLKKLEKLTDEL